jgi:hypothetical protein
MNRITNADKLTSSLPNGKAHVGGSLLSDEEMREPIENALYATKRFLTTQATYLAEGIIEYLKDAGFKIVRTDR